MWANPLIAENLTGPVAHHAEGPVWSLGWGGLRYVDLSEGSLLTVHGDTVTRLHIGSAIAGFVRPRAAGGYVVATERGIAISDYADDAPSRWVELWSDPTVRMNDGTTDPQGRLYAGSMAYDAELGRGTLYRIDPDLSWRVAIANVTISNGMAFSPDASLAYYADSATGRVDVFDHADGALTNRRPFVAIEADAGAPDGLTVAADGSVWVALWGGSAVRGYAASGALMTIVELPATQVSACTFGGDNLDTLFITTSRQDLAADQQPEAGSVFQVQVGIRGLPVVPFAG